jgi:tetrapyrrole methylase family protein/MazG family protein
VDCRVEAPDASLPPLERLRLIVARLRAPDGCPWDRAQTPASLRGALLEETYEVLAAIEAGDDANLREELGDLLLHVVMHAQMAAEREAFDLDAVADVVCEKMIRRHPHVFGTVAAPDAAAVLANWDAIKWREKGTAPESRMDGLPVILPALLKAQKAQEKAARAGFDSPAAAGVLAKVREEVEEVSGEMGRQEPDPAALAEEIGDLLFSAVNLARWHRLEAELVLEQATRKFVHRFQRMETELKACGRLWEEASPGDLDALWEATKAAPAAAPSMNERTGVTVEDNALNC